MTLPVVTSRAVLERGGLYALTGVHFARTLRHREIVEAFLDGGADLIQLRDKQMETSDYLRTARELHAACEARGVPFVVNDRIDVALSMGAEGVHLGQDDLPIADARSLARACGRPDLLIGLSTHGPERAEAGLAAGADYLGVGPIFPTRTKNYYVGIGYARWAGRRLRLPWTVSGGVTEQRLAEIAATGARWIAAIQALNEPEDVAAATRTLKRRWEAARAAASRATPPTGAGR